MANKKPIRRNKKQDWSSSEISYLKKKYPIEDSKIISAELRRTFASIRGKAVILNLKKENRYWTKKDEKFVIKSFPIMTYDEIAASLGRTRWAVINKYRELIGKR